MPAKLVEGYLHIGQILEYKSLVEFGIQILAVNFGFVFWFLVGKKINLDEWIRESCGPVRGRQVATLDNLGKIFKLMGKIFQGLNIPSLSTLGL